MESRPGLTAQGHVRDDARPKRGAPSPLPGPGPRASTLLTQVVCVAEVEHIAAVHVVVQRLLDQVLRLVPGQLGHPGGGRGLRESRRPAHCLSFKPILVLPTNQVLQGRG